MLTVTSDMGFPYAILNMAFSDCRKEKIMIRIPILKVKDSCRNHTEHIVGEDTHDFVYINKDGHIVYENLQCGETTDGGDYEFVGNKSPEADSDWRYDNGTAEIEMLPLTELVEREIKRLDKDSEEYPKLLDDLKRLFEAEKKNRKAHKDAAEKTRLHIIS